MKLHAFSLTLLFSLILSISIFAQEDWVMVEMDYPAIEKAISKKKSPFFYKDLFKRYVALDTTLTQEDFWHLYYGYSFQDEYDSLKRMESDTLRTLLRKQSLTEEEKVMIVNEAKLALEDIPFDLELIYIVAVCYDALGDSMNYNLWSHRLNGLLDTVLSSGDGLTKETAIHAISVSHEYFLLDIIGFRYGGEQELYTPCDYLKVAENEYEIEGIYFNVSRHFAYMNKLFNGKD